MDNIDIKEHDLLDDPRIRGLFPELSLVKDELMDPGCENCGEETNKLVKYNSNYLDLKPEPPDKIEDTYPQGSVEYQSEDDFETTLQTASRKELNSIFLRLHQTAYNPNKIILGSKPAPETSLRSPNPTYMSVVLEDWAHRLSRSRSYCADCKILFATPKALDTHKMFAHSLLVARHFNKSVKSTEPRNKLLENTSTSEGQPSGSKFCNHCSTIFSSNIELIEHLYQLLPVAPKNVFPCDECSVTFETSKQLSDHKTKHVASTKLSRPARFACQSCDIQFLTYKQALRHRHSCHNIDPSLAVTTRIKKTTTSRIVQLISKSTLFKCTNCGCHFLTAFVGIFHMNTCVSLDTPSKKIVYCKICQRKLAPQCIRDHMKQHDHTDKINVYNINDVRGWTLCRCPSCDVCFDEHTYQLHCKADCDGSQGAAEMCLKCNVKVDRKKDHMKVHSQNAAKKFVITEFFHDKDPVKRKLAPTQAKPSLHSKKLKLRHTGTVIQDNQQKSIVLYYCSKCECCSINKEQAWMHKKSCDISVRRACTQCGIFVASYRTLKIHWRIHQRLSFNLADVNFIDIDTNEPVVPTPPKYSWCKLCEARVLNLGIHECGVQKTTTCDVCFTKLELPAHKLHVEFHKLIKKAPTNVKAKPQSDSGVSVHQIHESDRKVENIIFQCSHCDVAVDSYDRAVVHSQMHITKIHTKQPTFICSECNLTFLWIDYLGHKKLHTENMALKADDFLFLKYYPEHLMVEKWFDLFKGLPDTQVKQIISQSKYAHVRSIRMTTFKHGKPELTIYLCDKCKLCVNNNNILGHIEACPETTDYRCLYCTLRFESRRGLQTHMDHHKIYNTGGNFRIIKFNQQKYHSIYTILVKKFSKELSFYTCTKCNIAVHDKKSITKEDHNCRLTKAKRKHCDYCDLDFSTQGFVCHLKQHAKNKNLNRHNIKVFPVKPIVSKVEVAKTPFPKRSELNRDSNYTFYQCAGCKVSYQNVDRLTNVHQCLYNGKRIACPICPNLVFTAQGFKHHKSMHVKCQNMNNNTVKVIIVNEEMKDSKFVGRPIVKGTFAETQKEKSKYIFYQCSRCKTCCSRKLRSHVCTAIKRRFTCSACSLIFSAQAIKRHRLLHSRLKNMNKNTIAVKTIEFKITPCDVDEHDRFVSKESTVSESDSNSRIQIAETITTIPSKRRQTLIFYQCVNCKTCYQSRRDKINGFHRCKRKTPTTYECLICKISISIKSKDHHIELHKKYNLNSDTIMVVPFYTQADNDKIHASKHDLDKIDIDADSKDTRKTLKTGQFVYYRCATCQLCCRKVNSLSKSMHTCSSRKNLFTCHTCQIDLSDPGYKRHKKLHEVYKNLNKYTVRIVTVHNNDKDVDTQEEKKNMETIVTSCDSVADDSNYETLTDLDATIDHGEAVLRSVKPNTFSMFQCTTCNICYHSKTNLMENHLCDEDKYCCDACKVFIPQRERRVNSKKHKRYPNLTAETLKLELYKQPEYITAAAIV